MRGNEEKKRVQAPVLRRGVAEGSASEKKEGGSGGKSQLLQTEKTPEDKKKGTASRSRSNNFWRVRKMVWKNQVGQLVRKSGSSGMKAKRAFQCRMKEAVVG